LAALIHDLKFKIDAPNSLLSRLRFVKIVGFNLLKERFFKYKKNHEIAPWMKILHLEKWISSVKIIHSFCNPIKRLQSEFVHVTSTHDTNWTIGKSSLYEVKFF
jgi:hypothetical protein